ncbi:MAG: glycosyltransferase family 2 protein [Candidatus Saccharibacteria bacterium]
MKQKISIVIAAYNEEPRIAEVLKVVEKHPLISEVIVVNDGSQDKTSEVARRFDVTLLENPKNIGKTLSVKRGIEHAKGDIIMLIDADLKGLNDDSIRRLAAPVINGEVDWTLSLRDNSTWFMKLAKMDWISGERVVPKKLLLDDVIWSRPDISYGLETLMNKSLLMQGTTFCSVYLPNLTITNKSEKIGAFRGAIGEIQMFRQIFRVLPLFGVFWQFFKMASLNKKYSSKTHHNNLLQ